MKLKQLISGNSPLEPTDHDIILVIHFLEHCYDFEVGKVRVLPGNNTVEVCRHISYYSGNSWSKVCGYDWDCREATVACREFLGIDNPSESLKSSSHFDSVE